MSKKYGKTLKVTRAYKWHKVATYWKGAFVNACQNQLRDNEVYRKRISELEKELGRQ